MAPGHDLGVERFAFLQPPLEVVRFANDDVQWKRRVDGEADLDGLPQLIPARHDDQNVHIAVGVRLAVGVRAEEDNLLRLEFFGDLAGKAADRGLRHIRAAIPAGRLLLRRSAAFGGHTRILS